MTGPFAAPDQVALPKQLLFPLFELPACLSLHYFQKKLGDHDHMIRPFYTVKFDRYRVEQVHISELRKLADIEKGGEVEYLFLPALESELKPVTIQRLNFDYRRVHDHPPFYFRGLIGKGSSPFEVNSQSANSTSLRSSAQARTSFVCQCPIVKFVMHRDSQRLRLLYFSGRSPP